MRRSWVGIVGWLAATGGGCQGNPPPGDPSPLVVAATFGGDGPESDDDAHASEPDRSARLRLAVTQIDPPPDVGVAGNGAFVPLPSAAANTPCERRVQLGVSTVCLQSDRLVLRRLELGREVVVGEYQRGALLDADAEIAVVAGGCGPAGSAPVDLTVCLFSGDGGDPRTLRLPDRLAPREDFALGVVHAGSGLLVASNGTAFVSFAPGGRIQLASLAEMLERDGAKPRTRPSCGELAAVEALRRQASGEIELRFAYLCGDPVSQAFSVRARLEVAPGAGSLGDLRWNKLAEQVLRP